MNKREIYEFRSTPREADYEAVILSSAALAQEVGYVIRPNETGMSDRGKQVIRELQPKLVRQSKVWTWPGSEILETASPYDYLVYGCDPDVVQVLLSASQRFEDWANPDLPEDLHFLRDDGSVILGSIAQEDYVWLELTPQEYDAWVRQSTRDLATFVRKRDADAG